MAVSNKKRPAPLKLAEFFLLWMLPRTGVFWIAEFSAAFWAGAECRRVYYGDGQGPEPQ